MPKTSTSPQNRAAQYNLSDLEVFTVIVERGRFSKSKSCGQDEILEFTDLPVGHYTVTAIVKNADGTVTGRGDVTSVDIEADVMKEVTISIHRLNHYTIQFYNNSAATPLSVEVSNGEKLPKPANPTTSGHLKFDGWYTSSDGGTTLSSAYNFNSPVTSDFNLYAKWSIDYTGLAEGDILCADGNWFSKDEFVYGTDNGDFIAWKYSGTWYAVTRHMGYDTWNVTDSAKPAVIDNIGGAWILPNKAMLLSFATSNYTSTARYAGYQKLFGSGGDPWSEGTAVTGSAFGMDDGNIEYWTSDNNAGNLFYLVSINRNNSSTAHDPWDYDANYLYMCPLTLP